MLRCPFLGGMGLEFASTFCISTLVWFCPIEAENCHSALWLLAYIINISCTWGMIIRYGCLIGSSFYHLNDQCKHHTWEKKKIPFVLGGQSVYTIWKHLLSTCCEAGHWIYSKMVPYPSFWIWAINERPHPCAVSVYEGIPSCFSQRSFHLSM